MLIELKVKQMKNSIHKLKWGATLLLFIFTNTVVAKKKSIVKTRTVNEVYQVNSEQLISLDNRFGELKVTSWDKPEVSVNITITVKNNSEKRAQQLFDKIKIDIVENDKTLDIETLIGKDNKNIKINAKGSNTLSIDYDIKVPSTNRLRVSNSFGPLIINKMIADVKARVNFGSATIGELNGQNNDLRFNFSDPVIISFINRGKIRLEHSKLELIRSNDLALTSDMSSSKIDRLKKGVINLKFGSSEINETAELVLNSQMSSVKIKKLHTKARMDMKYGSLAIAEVSKAIEKIDIDSEFSPISIHLKKGGSYEIDADVSMGNLDLPFNSGDIKKSDINKSSYNGNIGKTNEKQGIVRVQSSFGKVSIKLTD